MIEFQEACFSYGPKTVLRDVTLTLAPGSFHFLVGPPGSGKSTLLRLCHLDLAPTSGEVRVFGRRLRPRDRDAVADLRRTMGVVHQDCRFLDHLTLAENVALPLRVGGLDVADRADDVRSLLEWVDLTDRAEVRPRELSGGERRRAALARAVILSPEIILADEPAGAADRDMALRLLTLLVELNRMGKTILVATHDLDLVGAAKARVPARVLRLADGGVAPAEDDA